MHVMVKYVRENVRNIILAATAKFLFGNRAEAARSYCQFNFQKKEKNERNIFDYSLINKDFPNSFLVVEGTYEGCIYILIYSIRFLIFN